MKQFLFFFFLIVTIWSVKAQQIKVLFDATKAETANNADWVIDEDLNNMTWNPNASVGSGNEGNAQRVPSPAQSGITANTSETYWKGALSAWGIDCVKRGYFVESLPYNGAITYGNTSNAQDLSNYNIFIVCEPNILFSAAEKAAVINFVQNGGSLFMVSDHNNSDRNGDGKDSPTIWNDLMGNNSVKTNPFGITFDLLDISPNSFNIPTLPNDSLLHGPMGNVTQTQWFNGTSMTINPSVNTSVKGVVYTPGSSFGNTGVMMAYARFGKGKVAAIGDSSPCDDGTGDSGDQLYNGWTVDASGNHERLIMNATIWLATKDTFTSPPPPLFRDMKMEAITEPIVFSKGIDSVQVRVSNKGAATIDTMTLSYQLNTLPVVTASFNGLKLAPNATYVHTFSTPVNISNDGTYTICARVTVNGDTVMANDTVCRQFVINTSGVLKRNPDLNFPELYPNPYYGNSLMIKNTQEKFFEFHITNMQGQELWAGKSDEAQVNVSLPLITPGIYFVTMVTEYGIHIQKWVKY